MKTRRDFEQYVAGRMAECFADDCSTAIFGAPGRGTATLAEPDTLTADKLAKLMGEWANLQARMKRTSLTIVVRQEYDGPPVLEKSATDGAFAEMSWRQAQHLHEHHCPLILQEIIDEQTAHFRPAHQFDRFVPKVLYMPPYEMPNEGNDEPYPPLSAAQIIRR